MKESSDAFNRRRRKPQTPKSEPRKERPSYSKSHSLRNSNSNHSNYFRDDSDNNDDREHKFNNRDEYKGQRKSRATTSISSSFSLSKGISWTNNPCFRALDSCTDRFPETKRKVLDRYKRLSKTQVRLLVCAKILLFSLKLLFLHWLFSSSSSSSSMRWRSAFVGRPVSDYDLMELPIVIPRLDFSDGRDLGGWRHPRRFFRPPALYQKRNVTVPDFGGLAIYRTTDEATSHSKTTSSHHRARKTDVAPKRHISRKDLRKAEKYWKTETDKHWVHIHDYDKWPDDEEDEKHSCRFPNWVKRPKPLCNPMHELSLVDFSDKHYVSHGSFRDVWLVDEPPMVQKSNAATTSGNGPPPLTQTALKMSRFKCDYDQWTYIHIGNDATVMTQLASSPRIIDMFGHCGASLLVEPMPGQMEELALYKKGNGLIKKEKLHDEKELKPQNKFTIEEKLDMALTMAESMAELHGFPGGVIVHDDIQMAQFLKTPDGRLKFGDFNRAKILTYNEKEGSYCRYRGGGRMWRYRAPEEYRNWWNGTDWMDEKIDVYSYGNSIYALLTGLWPFYEMDDDEQVGFKVMKGSRSYIDPRWRTQGFIESKLIEVMEQCWRQDQDERIEIFEAVRQLRKIKKEYERRKTNALTV